MYTRFRALRDYTARLPLLESDPTCPRFGKDTRTAIIAGVQQGIVFELNGYLEEFTERYPNSVTILTGGDALFFAPACKTPVSVQPDLVMTGLNHILEFNAAGGKT
jgi:type III pantothenate kinase